MYGMQGGGRHGGGAAAPRTRDDFTLNVWEKVVVKVRERQAEGRGFGSLRRGGSVLKSRLIHKFTLILFFNMRKRSEAFFS